MGVRLMDNSGGGYQYNQPGQFPSGGVYCPGCRNNISNDAVVCPACGRQVKNLAFQQSRAHMPKDKTVAILLAIFLGLWTWVYTYDLDSTKFWINLVASIFTCGIWGVVAWLWAVIEVISRPPQFYENYPYV